MKRWLCMAAVLGLATLSLSCGESPPPPLANNTVRVTVDRLVTNSHLVVRKVTLELPKGYFVAVGGPAGALSARLMVANAKHRETIVRGEVVLVADLQENNRVKIYVSQSWNPGGEKTTYHRAPTGSLDGFFTWQLDTGLYPVGSKPFVLAALNDQAITLLIKD